MSEYDWDERSDEVFDAARDERVERERAYWAGRRIVDHLIDGEQR